MASCTLNTISNRYGTDNNYYNYCMAQTIVNNSILGLLFQVLVSLTSSEKMTFPRRNVRTGARAIRRTKRQRRKNDREKRNSFPQTKTTFFFLLTNHFFVLRNLRAKFCVLFFIISCNIVFVTFLFIFFISNNGV